MILLTLVEVFLFDVLFLFAELFDYLFQFFVLVKQKVETGNRSWEFILCSIIEQDHDQNHHQYPCQHSIQVICISLYSLWFPRCMKENEVDEDISQGQL